MNDDTVQTAIYKGNRKYDTYLYVEREDHFGRVPETLIDMLGVLEHVMTIELTADSRLASADVKQVMQDLQEKGFFLQLPPDATGIGHNTLTDYRRDDVNNKSEQGQVE